MSLSLQLRHSLSLELIGGAAASVFPLVDELLLEINYQEALQFVASRKSMNRYRSMVDFLLCEIFVQFRKDCFKFYEGKGNPFRHLIEDGVITEANREWCEKVLVYGLELARKACEANRTHRDYSWTKFSKEALALNVTSTQTSV